MFTFNLIDVLIPKNVKPKYFEPLLNKDDKKLGEIKKTIENLSKCPNCHFLIFDNYWSDDIEKINLKVCPTCGQKL